MESSKPAAELVKLNPKSEYAPGLEDTVILTMKGIAAGELTITAILRNSNQDLGDERKEAAD
ncbi:hypothetical protein F2Q69_00017895 [Brassica cretica]|uniref:Uncharacterized protein n=1 Tax=Brassica cretica TaxID=69181 RepID=A0A8S9R8K1_BRACR|nr:hypothetical protein F2Q69_00017895 [Brassica cretica]